MLQAFERARKHIDYYALDLSEAELFRTLAAVQGQYHYVNCRGLLGTYDDGLAWLKLPENVKRSKCILWLGSSLGNLNRTEAAAFLQSFTTVLGAHGKMLIGIDACQNKDKIYHAYNDRIGKTHEFVLNGLSHANRLAGRTIFHVSDWKVIGQYDEEAGRHQAFISPVKDVLFEDITIGAGEMIRVEESYKYSLLQIQELWHRAGLVPLAKYGDYSNQYREYNILDPSRFSSFQIRCLYQCLGKDMTRTCHKISCQA